MFGEQVETSAYLSEAPKRRSGWLNMTIAGIKIVPKLVKAVLAIGTFVAYSYLFGWRFAIVVIACLLIHECGHLVTMKRFGLKTHGIYLIPFVGAAAVSQEAFPSRRVEGVTALMGPVTGLALSLASTGIYALTGDPLWAAVAAWNALLNLFNLLPVSPLDGGRVVKSAIVSLNSKLNIVVFIAMTSLALFVMVTQHLWIFLLLLVVGVIEFFVDRRRPQLLPPLRPRDSWLLLSAYAGLGVSLWLVMLLASSEPGAALALHVLQD